MLRIFKTNSRNEKVKNITQDIKDEFFNIDNWHYNKRNIVLNIEKEQMVIASNKKKVSYLTLFEKNTNFNRTPKQSKRVILKKDAFVRITGKKSKDVKVTLYLIEYSKSTKLKVNRLLINQEKFINIHPRTESVRLAIRIEGTGEVVITNFRIYEDYIENQNIDKDVIYKRPIKEIKVACILDEFSTECFSDTVTLIPITPDNWERMLSRNRPDFLLVESAWRGNSGTWEYQIGKYSNNENNLKLKKLIYWCKLKRIPTVFWNKEDPIHFEKFIDAASLFDYIFTTDANIINKYKERVGHNRVFPMQFAANPIAHNPILYDKSKIEKISFAGSYYANRHEDRRKDMDEMLDVAQKFGLDIFDRNYERNKRELTHFRFPERFQKNIVGTLKYNQIDKAYKNYKFILNVNSVKFSPTMFSRRVFEGLACGTPILSSYSIGIKKTFKDIVLIMENKQEFEKAIQELIDDPLKYRELSMKGIREVFRYHTYDHRMSYILNKLKINFEKSKKDVTAIFNVNNIDEFNQAIKVVENQSYKDMKVIILIPLIENYETLLNNYNNEKISTYIKDYAFKYDAVPDLVSTEYVTIMNLDIEYGYYYIEDLVHAGTYSKADIIGKATINKTDELYAKNEYEFVETVIPETSVYRTNILKKVSLKELIKNQSKINEILFKEQGARIYSSDRFNIKINY